MQWLFSTTPRFRPECKDKEAEDAAYQASLDRARSYGEVGSLPQKIVLGILAGVAIMYVKQQITQAMVSRFSSLASFSRVISLQGRSTPVWSIGLLAAKSIIFAPNVEEPLCRGMMDLSEDAKRDEHLLQKVTRIVMSSAMFGAVHILLPAPNINSRLAHGLLSSVGGLGYQLLKEGTGDLTASVAAHMTNNALAMALGYGLLKL